MQSECSSLFDELDESQKKTVDDFHSNMQTEDVRMKEYPKLFSLRFLIGRNWNIQHSKEFIRNHLLWKELSYMHFMMEEVPISKDNLYVPGSISGYSKLGNPLFFSSVGAIDINGIRNTTPYMSIANQRFKITKSILDACEEASKRHNKEIHQAYGIFDFSGASLSSLVGDFRAFNSAIGVIVADNYPEVFKKLFFVNAKSIFSTLYGFIARFLSDRVKSKIYVLDSSPGETLLKYIDADQLPKCYGGSLEDPVGDPTCSNRIKYPKKIDTSQYYGNIFKIHKKEDLKEIKVSRGTTTTIPLGNLQAGQRIDWIVISDNYDIGFGINFEEVPDAKTKEGSAEKYQVLPPLRINSYLVPEEGYMTIKKTGSYSLIFDNSYSYFNGKKVFYKLNITK